MKCKIIRKDVAIAESLLPVIGEAFANFASTIPNVKFVGIRKEIKNVDADKDDMNNIEYHCDYNIDNNIIGWDITDFTRQVVELDKNRGKLLSYENIITHMKFNFIAWISTYINLEKDE